MMPIPATCYPKYFPGTGHGGELQYPISNTEYPTEQVPAAFGSNSLGYWIFRQRPLALHLLLLLSLILTGCREKPAASRTWLTMGTFASVTLAPAEANRVDEARQICEAITTELNTLMSTYSPDSEISRLNANGGGPATPVSAHTVRVLESSLYYAGLTGGAFDPTISPLVALWGFNGADVPSQVPDHDAIAAALAISGYEGLVLTNGTARLARDGMRIDLGAIAKGYAVDVCFNALQAAGFHNFMVNIGGNLRVQGRARPDRNWKIGVRHPFESDAMLGALRLETGMALATSGNYERFVTIDGQRYAHIIDPRSGRPVTGMAGVTILATSATEADAMSTALFVTGTETAPGLSEWLKTGHALFVHDEDPFDIVVTTGFRDVFNPLEAYQQRLQLLNERTSHADTPDDH